MDFLLIIRDCYTHVKVMQQFLRSILFQTDGEKKDKTKTVPRGVDRELFQRLRSNVDG